MLRSKLGMIALLLASTLGAQPGGVLFRGATLHIGNGNVVSDGVLAIRNGLIEYCGSAAEMPSGRTYAQEKLLHGQHIYPALIALNSSIGLREIDAVRATLDMAEVGEYNPHVRSMPAFNTDSKIIPTVRSNGVLMVQAVPQRGVLSGSSSVFRLDGWNWEDALLKADDGLHLHWPELPRAGASDSARSEKVLQKKAEILNYFTEARAYAQGKPNVKNLRFEAMRGLWTGKQTLFMHCDGARELAEAIPALKQRGVQKLVVVGGAQSHAVIPLLKAYQIPVVLSRIHRLPDTEDQDVRFPFKLPALLHDSGITVALSYDGDMEAMGTRNLAFTAGTASAYGLSSEEALAMISLHPARILGIDQEVGSLEAGKKAHFVISRGDLLDMRTASVSEAWLDGRSLSLLNHQKELWLKYAARYGLKVQD